MAKTPLSGFRAVIDRLTPTGTTGTFQESHTGFIEKPATDQYRTLQDLPGTPEEITDKTRSETLLTDQTFQTTFDSEPISGDGGDFIPINGDGESLPGASNGSKSLSNIGDDREPVRSFIKGAVRDLVDRIIVTINSSKRILDRANKYKDFKQEEKQ